MSIPTRRRLLAGLAAAPAALALPALPESAAADAPLFQMIARWRALGPIIDSLEAIHDACSEKYVRSCWSPEELEAHRIKQENNIWNGDGWEKSKFVTLEDIKRSDELDSPRFPVLEQHEESSENLWVLTFKRIYPAATEQDMAAWRGRCAARRALWELKAADEKASRAASGIKESLYNLDKAEEQRDLIQDEIVGYQPKSLEGMKAKAQWHPEYYARIYDESVGTEAIYFIRALQRDLESVLQNWAGPPTPSPA